MLVPIIGIINLNLVSILAISTPLSVREKMATLACPVSSGLLTVPARSRYSGRLLRPALSRGSTLSLRSARTARVVFNVGLRRLCLVRSDEAD